MFRPACRIHVPKQQQPKDTRRQPIVPLDVLVCTPDHLSETTQRFLKSLRDTTEDIAYTLRIADNRGKRPFIHAIEVNKALDAAEKAGHNLLICDDDTEHEDPLWLHKALDHAETLKNDFGVIGFRLSYPNQNCDASAAWSARSNGRVTLETHEFTEPVCVPAQCSACWLIAPTDLRWDDRYKKYRVELPFAFQQWERGKKVWVIPSKIRHDCGTQFKAVIPEGNNRHAIASGDEILYRKEWVETGRERRVLEMITPEMPPEIRNHREWPIIQSQPKMTTSKPEGRRKEKRALVTVMIGEGSKRLLPLFQRAADRWGARLFVIDETWNIDKKLTAHWAKWLVNSVVDQGYRVALIDGMDAAIMPYAPPIYDAVPYGTLGVYDETPVLASVGIDRRRTIEEFHGLFEETKGSYKWEYPGWYYNSGVMVFDESCNPFAVIPEMKCQFPENKYIGSNLHDQNYLNMVSCSIPVTLLDWKWNRMSMNYGDRYHKTSDMFSKDPYILHYCGGARDTRMLSDLSRIMPEPVERIPGTSADGLRDFWLWCGRNRTPVTIFEDGSAHGESLEIALSIFPEMKAICADPWNTPRYGEKAKADFMIRHGWNKNVQAVQGRTLDVLKTIPDNSLDVAYLDSIHEYGPLKAHIEAVLPKMKEGCIVAGHDYNKILWPGVIKAVNEMFLGPDIVFGDTTWAVLIKKAA